MWKYFQNFITCQIIFCWSIWSGHSFFFGGLQFPIVLWNPKNTLGTIIYVLSFSKRWNSPHLIFSAVRWCFSSKFIVLFLLSVCQSSTSIFLGHMKLILNLEIAQYFLLTYKLVFYSLFETCRTVSIIDSDTDSKFLF